MDQLIRLVSEKAGISEQQARTAVTTVLDFIKQRLPPNLASKVDDLAAGKNVDLGALGGLFGGR